MARKPLAKSLPEGVEIIGSSLRIRFMWNGKRCCETLSYPTTPQGIQAAADLRSTVKQLGRLGLLDDRKYAELFPRSRLLEQAAPCDQMTFGNFAQQYLNSLQVVENSRLGYRSLLNRFWMPALAAVPLTEITPALLQKITSGLSFPSDNRRRDAIGQLRRTLKCAVELDLLARNPADKLKLPKVMSKNIDPFEQEEADAIIAHLYKDKATELFGAYFELAFYTGMRPAEITALRWTEVNLKRRTLHVCRIVSRGKIAERVKNKKPRLVLLNERALNALGVARRLADGRTKRHRQFANTPYVFTHPAERSEYIKRTVQTADVFTTALAELGIRRRRQYNTRHTYATMCLMAGMNPSFIAKQLGHNERVMFERYATWIEGQADWAEMGKLMAGKPAEKEEIGTKVVQLPAALA